MLLRGLLRHIKHGEVNIVAQKPTKSKKARSLHVLPEARGYSRGGLGKWFGEKWTDVKTGKPCGRQKGDGRDYPACRPKAVASKISKKEAAKKTGPAKVAWSTTASGRTRT
jgi:hypothetical protein